MRTAVLHATWVRLPSFTPAVHEMFRAAGIDLFRVPAYSEAPTEVTLELEATDEYDALTRIREALAASGTSPPALDVIFPPYPFQGRERWGAGPRE